MPKQNVLQRKVCCLTYKWKNVKNTDFGGAETYMSVKRGQAVSQREFANAANVDAESKKQACKAPREAATQQAKNAAVELEKSKAERKLAEEARLGAEAARSQVRFFFAVCGSHALFHRVTDASNKQAGLARLDADAKKREAEGRRQVVVTQKVGGGVLCKKKRAFCNSRFWACNRLLRTSSLRMR